MHKGYKKAGLVTSNSPQPEEVPGTRKTTRDVRCTPRSSKTKCFQFVMDNGKTLKGKINATCL